VGVEVNAREVPTAGLREPSAARYTALVFEDIAFPVRILEDRTAIYVGADNLIFVRLFEKRL
jgi:hypothetical protein